MNFAYHFTGDTLRDGRSVPAVGEWLEHDGPLVLCESGLHWSLQPFDALKYAPGNMLHLVEYGGEVIHGDDKGISSRRRIIATIDAEPLLREFARWCALQVIELWDAPDVVRRYLESGDESLMAAAQEAAWAAVRAATWDAAWDAAQEAAWAAVRAAAWAAARAAAWAAVSQAAWDAVSQAAWAAAQEAAQEAQRDRLNSMVQAAFIAQGVKYE